MGAPSVTISDKTSAPHTMISDNNSASPRAISSDNQPPHHSPPLATTGTPPPYHSSPGIVNEAPPPVISAEANYSDSDSQDEEAVQRTGFVLTLGACDTTLNCQKQKKGHIRYPEKTVSQLPVENIPPPALKEDGTLRFPRAARMYQASRKFFRAAEPTYRFDGTPQMTIPSKVLRLGPENKEEYIVGQFHRCSCPLGGLIHAVLNRLWGRECEITCLGNTTPSHSHVMEEIPSKSTILESSQVSDHEQLSGPYSPHTLNRQQFRMEPEIPLSYEKRTGFEEIGDASSYSLTRGGSPIKPTQKIQKMEWTKARERGKKGHRSRGTSFNS
ncbi:hypothetical protein DY000_02049987 [Brassica cretica]|uniref:Uncharacterized protein n=1 Tax=Brassica cretica TaxID=69181 RepID=A0ABQ7EPJ9_BRACR|nr:hypothetical protein DY000_02049987 [Brassica cretica]